VESVTKAVETTAPTTAMMTLFRIELRKMPSSSICQWLQVSRSPGAINGGRSANTKKKGTAPERGQPHPRSDSNADGLAFPPTETNRASAPSSRLRISSRRVATTSNIIAPALTEPGSGEDAFVQRV